MNLTTARRGAVLALCLFLLITCAVLPAGAVSNTSNNGSYSISVGESRDLRPYIIFSREEEEWYLVGNLTWTSSNTAVATVDARGTVTGRRNGTAVITATGWDNRAQPITHSIVIGVNRSGSGASSASGTSLTVYQGKQVDLSRLYPDAVSVSWYSGDESIASVSAGGLLTGTGIGRCTVTAAVTGTDGSVDTRTLSVRVTSLELSDRSRAITIRTTAGTQLDLAAFYYPTVRSYSSIGGTFQITSDNTDLAVVDDRGVVTALATGSCHITLTHTERTQNAETVETQVFTLYIS